MIEFKSTEDLSKLSPEDDSYTILVEPKDAVRELTELWDGCRLTNIL